MKKIIIGILILFVMAWSVSADDPTGCCQFVDACFDGLSLINCQDMFHAGGPYESNPQMYVEWYSGSSCSSIAACDKVCCETEGCSNQESTRLQCTMSSPSVGGLNGNVIEENHLCTTCDLCIITPVCLDQSGTLSCVGNSIDCDDDIDCTDDTCDDNTGDCQNDPNDSLCDDDDACNGLEICDDVNDCQDGTSLDCGCGTCDSQTGCDCPGALTCSACGDCYAQTGSKSCDISGDSCDLTDTCGCDWVGGELCVPEFSTYGMIIAIIIIGISATLLIYKKRKK